MNDGDTKDLPESGVDGGDIAMEVRADDSKDAAAVRSFGQCENVTSQLDLEAVSSRLHSEERKWFTTDFMWLKRAKLERLWESLEEEEADRGDPLVLVGHSLDAMMVIIGTQHNKITALEQAIEEQSRQIRALTDALGRHQPGPLAH